ncbi:MAG: hypothetical protein AAF610_02270 [Pseudomonadota bacterium]
MYAVTYRFLLKNSDAETHAEFIEVWRALTDVFAKRRGALGSRLHKVDETTYMAYAQWPSQSAYEADAQSGGPEEPLASLRKRWALVCNPAEVMLAGDVVADLLRPVSFPHL